MLVLTDPDSSSSAPSHGDITLHQLRIFRAVAYSETLTKAAKQLGMAQPSLSQQLAKLEGLVGTKLFHRRPNEMALTEAGTYLLPKAEEVLRNVQDLEDGLGSFSGGDRVTVRLAGITSMLRILLPAAAAQTQQQFPKIDFDIQDSAPNDIVEMLYGRRINIGLLAANSVAQLSVGFVQVPLIEDPYVFAVPANLDLAGVTDVRSDLSPSALRVLSQSIQFSFGTPHSQRVEAWHSQMLPETRTVARCRSFEVAIGLVAAGAGVCLVPALSTLTAPEMLSKVKLYRVGIPARELVALVPSQYRRRQPYEALLDLLQAGAKGVELPSIIEPPPFFKQPSLSIF